ncbi:hypothetical protein 015DV004_68 [Bacillus phage 015DV004]|nr:hypothetical protein 015DV004_68 [Bacillus phage 015DV004]
MGYYEYLFKYAPVEAIEKSIAHKTRILNVFEAQVSDLEDDLVILNLSETSECAVEDRKEKIEYSIRRTKKEIQMLQDLLERVNNGEFVRYSEYVSIDNDSELFNLND